MNTYFLQHYSTTSCENPTVWFPGFVCTLCLSKCSSDGNYRPLVFLRGTTWTNCVLQVLFPPCTCRCRCSSERVCSDVWLDVMKPGGWRSFPLCPDELLWLAADWVFRLHLLSTGQIKDHRSSPSVFRGAEEAVWYPDRIARPSVWETVREENTWWHLHPCWIKHAWFTILWRSELPGWMFHSGDLRVAELPPSIRLVSCHRRQGNGDEPRCSQGRGRDDEDYDRAARYGKIFIKT